MPTKEKKKESAFQKPVKVSEALAEIVGSKPLARTEVTKRVWDYIKKHNLQDPNDKRTIRPDEKLKKIIGAKPVSMFELTKHVSKHLQAM